MVEGMIFLCCVAVGAMIWYAIENLKNVKELEKQRKNAERAFEYIMQHGTIEEKQLAIMYRQSQQTNALIGMVALGIFLE